jgi:hypothetical protein
MEKLISMTDFVLEVLKSAKPLNMAYFEFNIQKLKRIENFSKFLKQKLELWMFVPCKIVNDVWVVLKEPKNKNFSEEEKMAKIDMQYNQEYQEAKDRVLFEGFEVESLEVYLIWIYIKEYNSDKGDFRIQYAKKSKSFWYSFNEFKTVEDLVQYNLPLTPTAQKQIS